MAGVPKFGNWEDDGSVPYTQYFERARKGKGGANATNPTDPQRGNDSISSDAPPVQASMARTTATPHHAQAADPHENASRKTVGWNAGKASGDSQSRAPRTTARPERSVESSPLNQHTPGRVTDKGGSASPWQSKVPGERSHDFAPTAPGRSKLRQSDEIPEKVTAVPKFGDWDESDPSGGAGFTEVFRRVKEEKKNPSTEATYIIHEPEYNNHHSRANSGSWSWLSCFSGK